MAHYVGDACQPLHTSMFHDGRGDADKGVHSAYETKMVGAKRDTIVTGLGERLQNAPPLQRVEGHRAAGAAVVQLMDRSVTRLPPLEICDAFVADPHTQALWDVVGERTIDCIADGCQTLAMIWSSAWAEAGAAAPPAAAVPRDALVALYSDATFVPSLFLPEYADAGIW
jgi:hypothetical protein